MMKDLTLLNRAHEVSRDWAARANLYGHTVFPANYRLLLTLEKMKKPVKIQKIAQAMGVSVQTAGKTLRDMERQDYAHITKDPNDARVKLVELSEHGKRVLYL